MVISGSHRRAWWCTPSTVSLKRLRQEDHCNLKAILDYADSVTMRLCQMTDSVSVEERREGKRRGEQRRKERMGEDSFQRLGG